MFTKHLLRKQYLYHTTVVCGSRFMFAFLFDHYVFLRAREYRLPHAKGKPAVLPDHFQWCSSLVVINNFFFFLPHFTSTILSDVYVCVRVHMYNKGFTRMSWTNTRTPWAMYVGCWTLPAQSAYWIIVNSVHRYQCKRVSVLNGKCRHGVGRSPRCRGDSHRFPLNVSVSYWQNEYFFLSRLLELHYNDGKKLYGSCFHYSYSITSVQLSHFEWNEHQKDGISRFWSQTRQIFSIGHSIRRPNYACWMTDDTLGAL